MKSVIDILPWFIHSNTWTSWKEIWNEYIIQYLEVISCWRFSKINTGLMLFSCLMQLVFIYTFLLGGLCIYKEGEKVLREPSLVRMIWKEGPLKKNMFSFIWKKSIFLSCVFYCNIWGYPDRKALGYCICKSDTITPDIPYIPTCISLQQL